MRAARELLKDLKYEVLSGSIDVNVSELVYNTRKVKKECMFVCIKGATFDSHDVAGEAAKNGAVVIVAERPVDVPAGTTVVLVEDTRYALALISAAYFQYPAKKLKVIGITGTKGKTTTTFMIRSILEHAGIPTGLIGTIEVIIGDRHIPAHNTTPESYEVQEYFAQMVAAGCKVAVMEVSSQGLKLHRTAGIRFDIGIFTNLAPDHIGENEHASFEEYMECKSRLFRQCDLGIVNADDSHCSDILKGHTCKVETYGFSEKADLRASDLKLVNRPGFLGVDYHVSGLMDFDRFGVLTEDGLPPETIRELIHIAHEEGFAVMAHANGARTVEAAALAGVDSVEHGAYLDTDTLRAMRENGTVWVPTLSTIGNLRGTGRFDETAVAAILESAMENVAAFAAMGGLIAPGTDAGAWAVPHGSLSEYVLLEQVLGENAENILSRGAVEIQRKF